MKAGSLLALLLILIVGACTGEEKSPLWPGSLELQVNDTDISRGLFYFRDGSRHKAISSLDRLDVILVLEEVEDGVSISLNVHNAGKEAFDIGQLRISCDTDPGRTYSVSEEGNGSLSFRMQAGRDKQHFDLDLSASELLLLPGEEFGFSPIYLKIKQ